MPDSRPADYYLGCLDSSVFVDFNAVQDDKISLIRISFDGYGCCDFESNAVPLDKKDSETFIDIIKGEITEQNTVATIIKKAISLNKENIWTDALQEYNLI